jgi:hypothetical protein
MYVKERPRRCEGLKMRRAQMRGSEEESSEEFTNDRCEYSTARR